MRLNENTKIVGEHVILVPYKAKHVQKYHAWMQSKELQELTASMPLSLEQEYQMQKTWHADADKCTFLVLDRKLFENTADEIQALVGDTNLFLNINDDNINCAEIEIMIAEQHARGKGYGWEATLLMLKYGQLHLNIKQYIAKIGMKNLGSLHMFKKMHFQEIDKSEIFQEFTLACVINDNWIAWLDTHVTTLNCREYENAASKN